MKSKFATDPLDASDGFFNPDGAGFYANFFPAAGEGAGTRIPGGSPLISPTQTPTLSAEAVEAQSAQDGPGGPGSVVAETSGSGFTINLLFDAAAMAAPQSFRNGIEQAASILAATITNKITVNIQIDYSGTGGGAAAGPDNGQYESYSTVKADLVNNAAPGDTTFNALPSGSSIQGQSSVAVWNAQLKLFGLLGANDTTTDDGSATFATDINSNLLVGVALHELTHALGRIPYGSQPDIFDFYRFTSAGARLFTDSIPASAAYFSVDGGNTKIADYGLYSDPSDFLNPGPTQLGSPYSSLTPNDPFNEIYTGSTLQTLTAIDKEQLDALGFNTMPLVTTTVIQTDTNSFGSTSLVETGGNFFLENASTGLGPELKYQGSPVTVGEFVVGGSTWTMIGAALTASGYEVAGKLGSTNEYSVWSTDSNGNYTGNYYLPGPGNSSALESLETTFNQDLNGDGVIGIPAPIQTDTNSFGSTSLVETGGNFFLENASTGLGPELKYQGSPVTVGEFVVGGSTWTMIGAALTASGYEVAGKLGSTNEYSVWSTDSNGNYTGNYYLPGPGNSSALESLETSFNQDLNGDGVIGIPAPIQTDTNSFGSTSLVETGGNFFLENASTGLGPELKYQGSPVTVGEFVVGGSTWTMIGAALTASGYEVAGKLGSTNEYSVWSTDSNGNYTGNYYLPGPGNSSALESLETSFNQDLNGDGVIGIPAGTSPASHTATVTVVNNDTFVFGPGVSRGAGAASAPSLGDGGFFSFAGMQPAVSPHDAQFAQPQALFDLISHDVAGNSDSHAGASATDFHLIDLQHAGHFIIR